MAVSPEVASEAETLVQDPEEEARIRALRELHLLDTPAEERFDRIARIARRVFQVPFALVSLVDEDRQWFKACLGMEADETDREVSFCTHAIESDGPLVVKDALEDPRFENNPLVRGEPYIRFYAGHPIRAPGGRRIGTLCVIGQEPRSEVDPEDLEALRDLAAWVESELNVKRLSAAQQRLIEKLDTARRKALLDGLTQLWNREGIEQLLRAELADAGEHGEPTSIVMLDIDHFKEINDEHGHPVGDAVLRRAALRLRGGVRPSDALGRYGGEEFLCVLHHADSAAAMSVAERMRRRLTRRPFRAEGEDGERIELEVTASFGVATIREGADDAYAAAERIVAAADAALYRVKESGRDDIARARKDGRRQQPDSDADQAA